MPAPCGIICNLLPTLSPLLPVSACREAVATARSLLRQVRATDVAVASTRYKVLQAYALMAGKNKDVSVPRP